MSECAMETRRAGRLRPPTTSTEELRESRS
jgi:hypothetical protein